MENEEDNLSDIELQEKLNSQALEINDAICYSYNICKYCKYRRGFIPAIKTPCAEAFKLMKKLNPTLDFGPKYKIKEKIGPYKHKKPLSKISKFTRKGKFIQDYKSVKEACIENDITLATMYACLRDSKKNICGGFIWKKILL